MCLLVYGLTQLKLFLLFFSRPYELLRPHINFNSLESKIIPSTYHLDPSAKLQLRRTANCWWSAKKKKRHASWTRFSIFISTTIPPERSYLIFAQHLAQLIDLESCVICFYFITLKGNEPERTTTDWVLDDSRENQIGDRIFMSYMLWWPT